jgi:hypothetical protein
MLAAVQFRILCSLATYLNKTVKVQPILEHTHVKHVNIFVNLGIWNSHSGV